MADEFWPEFPDDLASSPEVGSRERYRRRDDGGDSNAKSKPDDRSGNQQPPQEEDQPLEPLETFSIADFAGKPVPEQEFLDRRQMFPARNVTLLQGDGGTGKSLLAMQLCMAVVGRSTWLGISVRHGAALYVSAEDDKTQNHIRAVGIAAAEDLDLAAMSGLRIAGLAGEDATLAIEDRKGRLSVTSLFKRLELTLANVKPQIVVLDNLADVFGGNEISRSQANSSSACCAVSRSASIAASCFSGIPHSPG